MTTPISTDPVAAVEATAAPDQLTSPAPGGEVFNAARAAAVARERSSPRANADRGSTSRASAPPSSPLSTTVKSKKKPKKADVASPSSRSRAAAASSSNVNGVANGAASSSTLQEGTPTPTGNNAFETMMRNARRAATSSPLPVELLDKAASSASSSTNPLATEILRAPPTLPTDPTYAPLDPERVTSLPTVLPLGWVAPQVPTDPNATNAPGGSGQSDKQKKKLPTYSLSPPEGYDGKVPYPLYAIVNGHADSAVGKSTGSSAAKGKGKLRKAKGKGIEASTSELAPSGSKAATPAEQRVRETSAVSDATASTAEAAATPQATSIPDAPALNRAGLEAGDDPSSSQASRLDSGVSMSQLANATIKAEPIPSQSSHSLSGSFPSSLAGEPLAIVSDSSSPSADIAEGSSLAADARIGADENDQVIEANGHGHLDSVTTTTIADEDDAIKQGSPIPIENDSIKDSSTDSKTTTPKPKPKAKNELQQLGNDLTAPSTPTSAVTMIKQQSAASASRSSSPASSIVDESGGARPSRQAAAKVAARGSYYDVAAYAVAAPAQAAVIHGIQTPPGRKSLNNLSAAGIGPPAPASTAVVKGKGKEKPSRLLANGSAPVEAVASGSTGEMVTGVDGTISADFVNNEFCSTCLGVGHFICCDSCPRSFHFACVNPPLDINEVPLNDDSTWHCQACTAVRKPPRKLTRKTDGIFAPLLQDLEQRNPTTFALPNEIKNFFKNVSAHADGSFVDLSKLRAIKTDKKGVIDERDPYRLRDAKGKEIMCYHCGESALPRSRTEEESLRQVKAEEKNLETRRAEVLGSESTGESSAPVKSQANGTGKKKKAGQISEPEGRDSLPPVNLTAITWQDELTIKQTQDWRPLVACDYCPLHFHLDCLDPPRATMPSNFKRWKCPCHIEDLLSKTRLPKSSTQLQVIDLPIPSVKNTGNGPGMFYRPIVRNSGQVDIIPDPMDTYFTSLSTSGPSAPTGGAATSSSSRSVAPGWTTLDMDSPLPPLADGEIPGGGIRKMRFRVPEKIVRTDWWMKVLAGGRDRLIDSDASKKAAEESGMALLLKAAAVQEEEQRWARGSDDELIRLALNADSPASMRLQPKGRFTPPPADPQGALPYPGGKLNRDEDEKLPESSMRGTLHLVDDDDDVEMKASDSNDKKRGSRALSSGAESELTDLSADEGVEDNKTPRAVKRIKLDLAATAAEKRSTDSDFEEEELQSLRAIREMMKRKGKTELLKFLQS